MKTLVTTLACLATLTASAQKIAADKVPADVQKAFSQKFPGATQARWETEKNGDFEVAFKARDGRHTANFSTTGTWLETETGIKVSAVPQEAKKYLAGKKIKEAARLEMADGSTHYEAEVGGVDYIFDTNGAFLRKQAD